MNALRKDKGLTIPSLSDENLLIFRKSKKKEGSEKDVRRRWEKQLLEDYHERVVDSEGISKQQCKMIFSVSFYDLEQLVEVQPEPGSCYISSSSEPFNEEMEIDFERLVNWLRHYGLPQYHAHVSGHIMPFALKEVLKEINTVKIFPVHTEHADLFAKFMRGLKSETVLAEKGKEYKI